MERYQRATEAEVVVTLGRGAQLPPRRVVLVDVDAACDRRRYICGVSMDDYDAAELHQRAASVSSLMRAKRTVTIPSPIAMLLELRVTHAIEPEAPLKLIEVNVARAQRQAKAEQVNRAPALLPVRLT